MSENLDLFGNPITAPTPIVQSAKDKDDALQVVWRPYKGPQVPCQDCAVEHPQGKRTSIGQGKHIRRDRDGEKVLCYFHKFEYTDRENRGIG